MYINTAMVFGNLTRDPELKTLPNGTAVASFSIATNRSHKKIDGTRVEETEFHNIIVYGAQAESCAQYLKKGSSAYVQGRLQTRSWDRRQYRTEIVADRVQFGPRPTKSDVVPETDPDHVPDAERAADAMPGGDYPTPESEDINPDDIPF